MEVTEKCDVYSFGVLALEVIKGEYPGDYIAQIMCPRPGNLQLEDLLDQRLSHPTKEVEEVLVSIIKLARGCVAANPKSRPTMHIVSELLAMGAQSPQHLGEKQLKIGRKPSLFRFFSMAPYQLTLPYSFPLCSGKWCSSDRRSDKDC